MCCQELPWATRLSSSTWPSQWETSTREKTDLLSHLSHVFDNKTSNLDKRRVWCGRFSDNTQVQVFKFSLLSIRGNFLEIGSGLTVGDDKHTLQWHMSGSSPLLPLQCIAENKPYEKCMQNVKPHLKVKQCLTSTFNDWRPSGWNWLTFNCLSSRLTSVKLTKVLKVYFISFKL